MGKSSPPPAPTPPTAAEISTANVESAKGLTRLQRAMQFGEELTKEGFVREGVPIPEGSTEIFEDVTTTEVVPTTLSDNGQYRVTVGSDGKITKTMEPHWDDLYVGKHWSEVLKDNPHFQQDGQQYIHSTTTTPEVYDREITTEATPGLLSMYQNQIAPAMSAMEAQYASDRAASEQALIEKYGAGITDKLREAAGNKELISQIIADASGETDPALLNQMVADAENAYGGQNVINQGPDILATAVRPGAEAGYVDQGQQSLQPAIDAGLLAAGQAELGAGDTEIDAALRARALERMGSGLTTAESRGLQQGQRQAWAARGLGTTLPSAAAEAFYLAERGEDRQRQNELMARGVSAELEARRQGRLGTGAGLIGQSYGQRLGAYQTDIGRSTGQQQLDLQSQLANQQAGLTAQEANRQYGLNVAAQNEANRFAQQQANRGYQGNVLGLQQQIRGGQFGRQMGAAQLGQQTSADPFLALLGRPSQAMGQAQGMGSQAYGMGQGLGGKIFQAESQMANDLAMANQQTQLAVSQANAANRNAGWTGMLGMGGSILGGGFAEGGRWAG